MEKALIASLLIDPKKFAEVRQIIGVEDFVDHKPKKIFAAIQSLFEEDKKIDLVFVHEKIGGEISRLELAEMANSEATSSFAVEYAKKIKQSSLTRKLQDLGKNLVITESVEQAEEEIIESLKRINEEKLQVSRSVDTILEDVLIEESEGRINGIQTGIKELDENTLALKSGHYWIIGAQYKTGKTLLAIEIARRVAVEHKVFFYTLEMSDDEIVSRMLKMEMQDKKRDEAIDQVSKIGKNLSIFSTQFRLSQIESHLLSQVETPKVVFVDYIGLVETGDKNIYERLNRVSRSLKLLAKRANCCVVVMSQINNESINKSTKTVGYKGSGDIPADCDVGIVLLRDFDCGLEHAPFTCDIRLNRHGNRAEINWSFDTKNGNIIF